MGMGFILPFAPTSVAILLETFVHSLRTLLGLIGIALLRVMAIMLRVAANICRYSGALVQQLHDLPLFIPLWLEERVSRRDDEHGRDGLRELTS